MKKILVFTLLSLAACQTNPMPQTTSSFKEEAGTKTKPMRARVADFFYPEVDHEHLAEPVPVVTVQPTCYSTWDKPICYEQPQRGIDGNIVN